MITNRRSRIALMLLLMATGATALCAQKGGYLTEEEEDNIREAQEPSARIEVYMALAQARLDQIDDYREKPPDPDYDIAGYLDKLTGQYISLTDELKGWIQDQYDRQGDMRSGLRKFLEVGPKQLEELSHIQQSPGPYGAAYAKSLSDAIDDLGDALDGATKALSSQNKIFADIKREDRAAVTAAKERVKEEKKRAKEERKLRKQQQRKNAPPDADSN